MPLGLGAGHARITPTRVGSGHNMVSEKFVATDNPHACGERASLPGSLRRRQKNTGSSASLSETCPIPDWRSLAGCAPSTICSRGARAISDRPSRSTTLRRFAPAVVTAKCCSSPDGCTRHADPSPISLTTSPPQPVSHSGSQSPNVKASHRLSHPLGQRTAQSGACRTD